MADELLRFIPGGTSPPADVPPAIFTAALSSFEECRRLDMGGLATELGMGRATLYRRVGSREQLLGAVLWFRSRQAMALAFQAAAELRGAARLVAIVERYLDLVLTRPPLLALLKRDPEGSLRLLTSSDSPVHNGLRHALEELLAEEEERGVLQLTIDRETLAYVIVRVSESLIYANVTERDGPPDRQIAVDVIARLLAGSQVGALPRPQVASG